MGSKASEDYSFLSRDPGFSSKAVDRLGKYLAGKSEKPEQAASEIFSWYNGLAYEMALAAQRQAIVLFGSAGAPPNSHISFRVKSATTISDKIRRGNIQLSKMQDFAGARLTINCLHDGLRQLGDRLTEQITEAGNSVEQKDYLDSPQQGYRALHLWVKGNAGKVELQLRTLLQSEWANAFEQAAALSGRRIRYEEGYEPSDPVLAQIVRNLLDLSDTIYETERVQNETQRQNAQTLTYLASMPVTLPLAPELYRSRSDTFRALAESEDAQSKVAETSIALIDSLRQVAYSLKNYPADRATHEGHWR